MPEAVPRLLPTLTDVNTPFWTRGLNDELVILRHRETGAWIHPPELVSALDDTIEPEVVSGRGTVMTYTINHHAYNPDVPTPFIIAIVELIEDSAIRLPTNLIECASDAVYVGMPVKVVFELREDVAIPLFKPETPNLP